MTIIGAIGIKMWYVLNKTGENPFILPQSDNIIDHEKYVKKYVKDLLKEICPPR